MGIYPTNSTVELLRFSAKREGRKKKSFGWAVLSCRKKSKEREEGGSAAML
jgi:hypothetical protein